MKQKMHNRHTLVRVADLLDSLTAPRIFVGSPGPSPSWITLVAVATQFVHKFLSHIPDECQTETSKGKYNALHTTAAIFRPSDRS